MKLLSQGLPDRYSTEESRHQTVIDRLYNVQQLKECFGQQMKFYILYINEAVTLLNKCEPTLDDTIIRKLQEVETTWLKYTPLKEPAEYKRWRGIGQSYKVEVGGH